MKIPFLLALVLLLLLGVGPSAAQGLPTRPTPSRVPLTIVLARVLPNDSGEARYALQRRPGGVQHDVLLVREEITDREFSNAIWSVMMIRQMDGDTASRAATVRPQPGNATAARQQLPWAARVLNDLRQAGRKPVVGVGVGQAVEIWLPPQRRRSARG